MRSVTTDKGVEIKFYSSAKECSIDRYTEFQKYLLIESGIGSTCEDISRRFQNIDLLITSEKYSEAKTENENAFYALNSVLNGISYTSVAFACLVACIGQEMATDLSEDGLFATAEKIKQSGLTQQDLEDYIDDVKKKS
jgi:hypothetical protein